MVSEGNQPGHSKTWKAALSDFNPMREEPWFGLGFHKQLNHIIPLKK